MAYAPGFGGLRRKGTDADAPAGAKNFSALFVPGWDIRCYPGGRQVESRPREKPGSIWIAHRALTGRKLDLYSEYRRMACNTMLKAPVGSGPEAIYRRMKTLHQ